MTQRRTDQSAIRTWLVLMKAHRTLTRHATRSIEALDMCLSDFAILEALLHKGPQSVRELGRRIELTSGSMTTAIDRLETRHLVKRADHATDRRAWVIHLTPQGEALITKVFAGHEDAMERAMRGLSKTERATLTDLLKRLGTTAEEQLTQEQGTKTAISICVPTTSSPSTPIRPSPSTAAVSSGRAPTRTTSSAR